MTILNLDKKENKEKKIVLTKQKKILNFLSSAFIATAQTEFYNNKEEQRDAILNTHKPILEDYREFYALVLLSNINDLNKQIIIYNLLRKGKKIDVEQKHIENEIIFQSLEKMPIQRAFKTFKMLKHLKVNNFRTRWLAEKFLMSRKNIHFECVKYKKAIKELVVHNHIFFKDSEVFDFLFDKKIEYKNKWFKKYIKAKTDPEAIYDLPFTVAEGFAVLHKIPKDEFLKKIKKQMTEGEKLRMQNTAKKEGVKIQADWTKMDLVQMFKFLRTQTRITAKHKEIVESTAKRIADSMIVEFGKVRVVLDNSGSSYSSDEKKYHSISVGQAVSEVLKYCCDDFKEILINGTKKGLLASVGGSTNLGKAILKALKDKPELLVIISDGYENEPAGLTSQILNVYKSKIDKNLRVFHINPVFAAEVETSRRLAENIPVVGIRDVKELQTSFFLLKANENLTQAIDEFKTQLLENKKVVNLKRVKNYLLN